MARFQAKNDGSNTIEKCAKFPVFLVRGLFGFWNWHGSCLYARADAYAGASEIIQPPYSPLEVNVWGYGCGIGGYGLSDGRGVRAGGWVRGCVVAQNGRYVQKPGGYWMPQSIPCHRIGT